jgi:hypothetical protein
MHLVEQRMKQPGVIRGAIALIVIACILVVGCAHQLAQSPGQTALLCGAGGTLAGAAIGGAVSRNWQGALIGAAVGALAAGLTCFAFAEYKSQQVRDYRQTQQATDYQPSQGDRVQITQYEITPAAAAPGSSVAFNATYTVMTADPDADVVVTEIRSLYFHDPRTNEWKELGRVPNQVTVKPGTRQANGKFDVRSGVAPGDYRIAFQVVKDTVSDGKNLPLLVTTNQAALSAPQARIAQLSGPGAQPIVAGQIGYATPAAPASQPAAAPIADNRPGSGQPLSALGEQQPAAPSLRVAAAAPEASKTPAARTSYFVASRVSGAGSLRSGPGASHNVVGTIGQGERHPIVERRADWYKIRLDGGAEVWVAAALGHEVEE